MENDQTPFTSICNAGEVLKIPIAHGEGNFYHFNDEIKKLEDNNQILFRYVDKDGHINDKANPNGSINNIAGIVNKQGNVMGMMPHPERAVESILGSGDGLKVFESLRKTISPVTKAG